MDSLHKLKRRGIDNISKVKRTGMDYVNKYNACKLVNNPFTDNNNTNNTNNNDQSIKYSKLNTHTPSHKHSPLNPNTNEIRHGLNNNNWDIYNNEKIMENGSQFSLNSETSTLVNNSSSSTTTNIPNNKHSFRRFSYDNSTINSSTTINISSSSPVPSSSFPSSSSSPSPSPIFSRAGSVVSSSSTLLHVDTTSNITSTSTTTTTTTQTKGNLILNDKIKLYIQKNQHTPKHLLKPNDDIKSFIINHGHENAFIQGKNNLLHYYQLPFPWRENRYIIHNYRFYHSHKKSLLSIFNWYGWHNETSNIWSHLLGAFYIIYLALYDFPHSKIFQSNQVPRGAKFMVYVFLLAAFKCLLASVFWHTFNGTSFLKLRRKFACVDYSGISILITSSILTAEFVSLYNHKWPMYSYMLISLTLGTIGVFLNCSPRFDSPEARPLRIRFFILLASMGILSFMHATYLESLTFSKSLLAPIINKSVVWYLIGVMFYGSFVPERFRSDVIVDDSIPTTFQLATDIDIVTRDERVHFRDSPCCNRGARRGVLSLWWVDYIGCSHTFWHVFVVLGVIGHYKAIIDMFGSLWL